MIDFQFSKFKMPLVIRAMDTKVPLVLNFHLNETGVHFKTHLLLHTNASIFYIPVYAYNGKIQVRCMQLDRFDYVAIFVKTKLSVW